MWKFHNQELYLEMSQLRCQFGRPGNMLFSRNNFSTENLTLKATFYNEKRIQLREACLTRTYLIFVAQVTHGVGVKILKWEENFHI